MAMPTAVDPLGETYAPLTEHEAFVESSRCLYCYDAPCTHACPTHIDVPKFIKKIASRNLLGSARTIMESNLLGATCSRVCPVQELCEGACVLGAEHKPITIGRLQRYAMDFVAANGIDVFTPGAPTGKSVAVVGSGPAGLTCAGELARLGHSVTLYEKRDLGGGLSTYGIIALREPVEVSLKEVEMVKRLGVRFEPNKELGKDLELDELSQKFDAVFLGIGLGSTPAMGIEGEEHIVDGLQYIEDSKVARSSLQIGRRVLVIGAGNTAVDCATIAKRLGAERVTMVYRRTESQMSMYDHEYEFIKGEGVDFRFLAQPNRVLHENGAVTGLECLRMELGVADASGRPSPMPVPGSEFVMEADQIVKAVGQEKPALAKRYGLETEKGFIKVSDGFETSAPRVFAGGDAIRSRGDASTVMAVQDGKLAAQEIHQSLMS